MINQYWIEITLLHNKDEATEEENSYIIEPGRLYSIINEKSTSFLLLDARPSEHYKAQCRILHFLSYSKNCFHNYFLTLYWTFTYFSTQIFNTMKVNFTFSFENDF